MLLSKILGYDFSMPKQLDENEWYSQLTSCFICVNSKLPVELVDSIHCFYFHYISKCFEKKKITGYHNEDISTTSGITKLKKEGTVGFFI